MPTPSELFDIANNAFNSHDRATFASVVADDCESAGPGMTAQGKDASIQFSWGWQEACPDSHGEVHAKYVAGDTVIAEGTFTGTHTGILRSPMGDIQPTGRSIRGDYTLIVRYRDGKAISQHLMFDRLELLEQLGLLPAPARA